MFLNASPLSFVLGQDYLNSLIRLQRFIQMASAAAAAVLHSDDVANALPEQPAVTTAAADSATDTAVEAKKIKLSSSSKGGQSPSTIPKAASFSGDAADDGDGSTSSAAGERGTDAAPSCSQAEGVEPEDMSIPPSLVAQVGAPLLDIQPAGVYSCWYHARSLSRQGH